MELFAATPQATPSVREFLFHAYAERRRAAAIFGIVLGLALLGAAQLTPRYRASAVLAVLPSPEFTVRAVAGSHEVNASALALDQIMKAETEILGSDDLHAATLLKVGPDRIYPDLFLPPPPSWLSKASSVVLNTLIGPWRVGVRDQTAVLDETGLHRFRADLTVLPAKDSNVITLNFDSCNGEIAANVINTMLGLYAMRRTRLYDDPQLGIVRREAADSARAVAEAGRLLSDYKRAHAISDFEVERDLLLHQRSQAEQTTVEAEASVHEYEARLDALSHALRVEPATIGVFDEKDSDTRLLAVNAGLQDLRSKLAAARDKYKDTSRVVTAFLAEIASHESEARRLSHDSTQSVVRQGRNPSIDPLRLDRARAAAELAASQARFDSGQGQGRAIGATLARYDAEEADLAALQLRQANAEEDFRNASRILADRHLIEAEEASRLANVRVIQPANVPQVPRSTGLLVIAAGLVLGVLAAGGWVLARFMLMPVFLTGEGLESITGLPVLAVFDRSAKHQVDDRCLIA